MHFAARSALFASCLAISVRALPVTYSVVDVDGGSAAAAANGATDRPVATVYHTVTKSTEVEVPEATTVSVSVTVVETKDASVKSVDISSSSSSRASSSTSSSSSSLRASAQASSSASLPSATSTGTSDAASVLEPAKSTFLTRPTSTRSTASAKSTIVQAPPVASASHVSHTESGCECDASSVTVTAEAPGTKQTVTATKGETVVSLTTTTVTPAASSTSYYDDGMWHTRYAIKPVPSPEAEKPSPTNEDVALQSNVQKQSQVSPSVSISFQALNGTSNARRKVEPIIATPTASPTPSIDATEVSDAPLMFVQSLRAEPIDVAADAKPTSNVDATPEVLAAEDGLPAEYLARRAPTYSVVSWNETAQG